MIWALRHHFGDETIPDVRVPDVGHFSGGLSSRLSFASVISASSTVW
ncbi:hypothetical protein KCP74_24890 [Salmonella enterica subsp. enterica]|nr:hypothetical protein KCP74_24890 [Salmonella enterica subsp. enterica]